MFGKNILYLFVLFGVVIFSVSMLSHLTDSALFKFVFAQSIKDSDLALSPAFSGFSSPTGIAFLDDSANNVLVIEKKGNVKLISKGVVQESPIFKFNVDSQSERGLLGVEVLKNNDNTFVFFM